MTSCWQRTHLVVVPIYGNRRRRCGFSLVELLVVLTLIGLVAAVATVSFRGPLQAARFGRFCEQLKQIDQSSRRSATAAGHSVAVDYNSPLRIIKSGRWNREEYFAITHTIPRGIELEEIRFVGESMERRFHQAARILVSASGSSLTYGVVVSSGDSRRWLVFLGLTGQCIEFENEQKFILLFKELAASGIDHD